MTLKLDQLKRLILVWIVPTNPGLFLLNLFNLYTFVFYRDLYKSHSMRIGSFMSLIKLSIIK